MPRLGIAMPIYNRPEYLQVTLDNLKTTIIPQDYEVTLLMVDDCSVDATTKELIAGFEMPGISIIKMDNSSNLKTWGTLRNGFDVLYNDGYDILMNLDADAKLKPYWLQRILDLNKRFPDTVVSGFNTISNHPVIEEKEDYYVKEHIGGFNMLFSRDLYPPIVRDAFDKMTGWDWDVCFTLFQKTGKRVLVTKPSVMQHIGYYSTLGWAPPGDTALDWEE